MFFLHSNLPNAQAYVTVTLSSPKPLILALKRELFKFNARPIISDGSQKMIKTFNNIYISTLKIFTQMLIGRDYISR